jgi:hypothetical protein
MIKIINELLGKLLELEKALQENNQRRVGSIMAEMRFLLDDALSLLNRGDKK